MLKCASCKELKPEENVCFISSRANRIKYDADENELELISKWLRSVKESSTTIP